MKIVLVLPMNSVWPSGSALSTDFAPIVPPAPPGRFSTTTGWPRKVAILSDRSRAMMSGGPPAGDDTTNLIGRSGKACAPGRTNCAARRINALAILGFMALSRRAERYDRGKLVHQ